MSEKRRLDTPLIEATELIEVYDIFHKAKCYRDYDYAGTVRDLADIDLASEYHGFGPGAEVKIVSRMIVKEEFENAPGWRSSGILNHSAPNSQAEDDKT